MVSHCQSRNCTNSAALESAILAEKADEYNDPGLGICRTDSVKRQEEKEIEGIRENKVEMAEMKVKWD